MHESWTRNVFHYCDFRYFRSFLFHLMSHGYDVMRRIRNKFSVVINCINECQYEIIIIMQPIVIQKSRILFFTMGYDIRDKLQSHTKLMQRKKKNAEFFALLIGFLLLLSVSRGSIDWKFTKESLFVWKK